MIIKVLLIMWLVGVVLVMKQVLSSSRRVIRQLGQILIKNARLDDTAKAEFINYWLEAHHTRRNLRILRNSIIEHEGELPR